MDKISKLGKENADGQFNENLSRIYQVLGTLLALERKNLIYGFCLKEIHYLQIMSQNQETSESFPFQK